MLSKIILHGVIASELIVSQTKAGRMMLSFDLSQGDPSVILCIAWGKCAEFIKRNFHTGGEIIVSGEFRLNPRENYIAIEDAHFCKKKEENIC